MERLKGAENLYSDERDESLLSSFLFCTNTSRERRESEKKERDRSKKGGREESKSIAISLVNSSSTE